MASTKFFFGGIFIIIMGSYSRKHTKRKPVKKRTVGEHKKPLVDKNMPFLEMFSPGARKKLEEIASILVKKLNLANKPST